MGMEGLPILAPFSNATASNVTVGESVVPDARLNDLELKSTLVGGRWGLFL